MNKVIILSGSRQEHDRIFMEYARQEFYEVVGVSDNIKNTASCFENPPIIYKLRYEMDLTMPQTGQEKRRERRKKKRK